MKRRTRIFVGLGVAMTGAMVAAHLPFVARAGGGCPWAAKPASAKTLEEFRVKTADTLRTETPAKGRPALGFVLDQTTSADVRAWATKQGLTCSEELQGAALRCEGEATRGAFQDVFFRFDPKGALVALDARHTGVEPAQAASSLKSLTTAIEGAAGSASAVRGEMTAAHLGSGRLSFAAVEFRFADYAADLVATNFGEKGVVLREQYKALPPKRTSAEPSEGAK